MSYQENLNLRLKTNLRFIAKVIRYIYNTDDLDPKLEDVPDAIYILTLRDSVSILLSGFDIMYREVAMERHTMMDKFMLTNGEELAEDILACHDCTRHLDYSTTEQPGSTGSFGINEDRRRCNNYLVSLEIEEWYTKVKSIYSEGSSSDASSYSLDRSVRRSRLL